MSHPGVASDGSHGALIEVAKWRPLLAAPSRRVEDRSRDVPAALHRGRRDHRKLAVVADGRRSEIADAESAVGAGYSKLRIKPDSPIAEPREAWAIGRVIWRDAGGPDDRL